MTCELAACAYKPAGNTDWEYALWTIVLHAGIPMIENAPPPASTITLN